MIVLYCKYCMYHILSNTCSSASLSIVSGEVIILNKKYCK